MVSKKWAVSIALLIVLVSGCAQTQETAKTATTPVSKKDKQALAQAAFKWAIIDKNIPDFQLIKDPANLIVSTQGISDDFQFTFKGFNVTILTPEEIQKKADKDGDFLYIKFASSAGGEDAFQVTENEAAVSVNIRWAQSSESKKKGSLYLSGGGAELHFKKKGKTWVFDRVGKIWIS